MTVPLVAGAVALTSCTGAPLSTWATSQSATATAGGCQAADVAGTELTREQVRGAVLCIVNRLRSERALVVLRSSAPLTRAADRHTADMVASGVFSHTGSRGDTLRQRAIRAGYVSRRGKLTLGETIAWGSGSYATAAELVDSFMESPEHRRIMLSPVYRDVGVGVQDGAPEPGVGGDAATITVDFGRR